MIKPHNFTKRKADAIQYCDASAFFNYGLQREQGSYPSAMACERVIAILDLFRYEQPSR